jgi:hypothetical protein
MSHESTSVMSIANQITPPEVDTGYFRIENLSGVRVGELVRRGSNWPYDEHWITYTAAGNNGTAAYVRPSSINTLVQLKLVYVGPSTVNLQTIWQTANGPSTP